MQHPAVDRPIHEQIEYLSAIIQADAELRRALDVLAKLELRNGYLGGGCLTQTVWNRLFDKPRGYGIDDLDFAYFDGDLSEAKEQETWQRVREELAGCPYQIDVKNEARVHLWYEERFGFPIRPYLSTEAAISTWPTTATAIGAFLDPTGQLRLFAPYGLNDLFSGVVKPNKKLITKEIYTAKASKWSQKWPELIIEDW